MLHKSWFSRLLWRQFYYIGWVIVRFLASLIVHYKCADRENVPRRGPLLIISNHLNIVDPPLIGLIVPRKINIVAKDELFHIPWLSWIIIGLGAIRVRRGEADRQMLRITDEILKAGGAVLMFPEGTRSKNGALQPGNPGAALIAIRADATILPVAIMGTGKVFKQFRFFPFPCQVEVRIGQPFKLQAPSSRLRGNELARQSDILMSHIAALLPPELRGAYSDKLSAEALSGAVSKIQRASTRKKLKLNG